MKLIEMTISHLISVQVAADLLTHAVAVLWMTEPGFDRDRQFKAVHRLARRLLAARLQWRKAQIVTATDVRSGKAVNRRAVEIAGLKRREAEIRAGGLEAILAEFAAPDFSAT